MHNFYVKTCPFCGETFVGETAFLDHMLDGFTFAESDLPDPCKDLDMLRRQGYCIDEFSRLYFPEETPELGGVNIDPNRIDEDPYLA